MKQIVGLCTTLHTFRSKERYLKERDKAERRGAVTEIFVNNGYAFELRLPRRIL